MNIVPIGKWIPIEITQYEEKETSQYRRITTIGECVTASINWNLQQNSPTTHGKIEVHLAGDIVYDTAPGRIRNLLIEINVPGMYVHRISKYFHITLTDLTIV